MRLVVIVGLTLVAKAIRPEDFDNMLPFYALWAIFCFLDAIDEYRRDRRFETLLKVKR